MARQCLAIRCKRGTIYALKWEVLPHAIFSDLVSSDYYLFRSLQHQLSDKHLNSEEDIQKCIDNFITSKQPLFFKDGIYNLLTRWENIIKKSEYFEI